MLISDILNLNTQRGKILLTLDVRLCIGVSLLKPRLLVPMAGNDSAICIDLKTLPLILLASCYI